MSLLQVLSKEKRAKLEKIVDEYGVYILGVSRNIQGTIDILLDTNIYYKAQAEMYNKIKALLPELNDLDYKDII